VIETRALPLSQAVTATIIIFN